MPGCEESQCCDAVCANDGFCCDMTWDAICVNHAQVLCGCRSPVSCGQPDAGGCCLPGPAGNGTPGCDNPVCCETVCDYIDPFCCDFEWDDMCATWAFQFCSPCPQVVCNPNAGPCCEAAQTPTPGCNNLDCCETVCEIDSFCCVFGWDIICADQANILCDICQQ